ncbi:MAG: transcriptional repressor [Coriobacteriales bacterium]|jgi:Fur family peroxide stress response transcriptional regulator|nr:transcriptional repressor [Coriobacteriales bacterium]
MARQRNSMQKLLITETLRRMDHPTAAEVYEQVRQDCPQISLGTVYRNLGSMADEGTVLRLSFTDEPDRFDPQTHEHFHVVCSCCGRIFDTDASIEPALVHRLDRAVERCTGVRVQSRSLLFEGVCAKCQEEGATAEVTVVQGAASAPRSTAQDFVAEVTVAQGAASAPRGTAGGVNGTGRSHSSIEQKSTRRQKGRNHVTHR